MSGIACIIASLGQSTLSEEIIHLMLSQIKHRGDEKHGCEVEILPHAAFGCNRLAITEHDDSHQPIVNEQKAVLAILDGRIYNYRDLRFELTSLGYQFQTNSEAEVLVYGYCEWKDKLVDHLDGMFAFIVYDIEAHSFLAARDHIGIKPLYYLRDRETYFISSEMKSLLKIGQNIRVLQPGHILTQYGVRDYFWLPEQPIEGDEGEIIATFKHLLTSAIEKQVQTNLPIGVMFSGGIDSATILRFALRYHSDVTAFSIGFKGATDISVAQRYCKENGIKHHVVYLNKNKDDLVHDLRQAVYYSETFEAINVMDMWTVSPAFKLAQEKGVRIMLCGDGSDELLAGYDFFKTYPDPHYLMTYRLNNTHRTDLQRIDRSSMRYSIEARVPFLDRAFLEFAYRIPMTMKLRHGIDKWILREALKEDLPDYILCRPKVRMPDGSGLQYHLLDFVRQQKTEVHPLLLAQLQIDPRDGAYFLDQYLKLGYPVPKERYKKPALDFSPHGYFDFITEAVEPHP